MSAGELRLNHVNALQNSTLNTGTSGAQFVTLFVTGTNTYNLGGLKGSDDIILNDDSISVGGNGQSTTFGGGLLGGTGGGGLTKVGTGTLTLSGGNTYTGATQVLDGSLVVSSTGSLSASSAITINGANASFIYNGAGALGNSLTLTQGTLGGTGTIGVAVTVDTGDVLSPGNSPGLQPYAAGLTWDDGGSYLWEINDWDGGVAGTDFDQIQVSGANLAIIGTTPGGFAIDITGLTAGDAVGSVPGFDPKSDRSWIIATTPGITGFDASLFTLDTTNFATFNPEGTFSLRVDGTDLVLDFVGIPEPASAVLLGLAGLVAWRRRR